MLKKIKNNIHFIEEFGLVIYLTQLISRVIDCKIVNPRAIQLMGEERLLSYLDKYKYVMESYEDKEVANINPVIWTCWLQGEENEPELIKKCIGSIKKYSGNRKVVVLTDNNISNYITVPEYIIDKRKKGIITDTHFSDIVRLLILSEYGGIWLDATCYLTDSFFDSMTSIPLFLIKAPLTCFCPRISSSWCISCHAHNEIIEKTKLLLLEYWKTEKYLRDYFLIHMCIVKVVNSSVTCKKKWDSIPYYDDSMPNYLRSIFDTEYTVEKWNEVKSKSSLHKLNWKICNHIPDKNGEKFADLFYRDKLI